MNSIQEFTETMVIIDFHEEQGFYGHYPFSMFVEKQGKEEFMALAMSNSVVEKYKMFKQKIEEGANRVYLALDFPAGGDMLNDFILVFHYENTAMKRFALPYDAETGKRFKRINESSKIEQIFNQFNRFVFP